MGGTVCVCVFFFFVYVLLLCVCVGGCVDFVWDVFLFFLRCFFVVVHLWWFIYLFIFLVCFFCMGFLRV